MYPDAFSILETLDKLTSAPKYQTASELFHLYTIIMNRVCIIYYCRSKRWLVEAALMNPNKDS